jgi:hypothetical protein
MIYIFAKLRSKHEVQENVQCEASNDDLRDLLPVPDKAHSLEVDDHLVNGKLVTHTFLQGKNSLPPRGGPGGGGGDLTLVLLGITAFRNTIIKSSVRNTGPGITR